MISVTLFLNRIGVMAGSTTKTVFEIFQTMDYGPSSSSPSTAQVKFMTDVKQAHVCRCW